MVEPLINERAQSLLKCLVEYYIREGQPVGSTTLARESKLDLSPATVRNAIADLERLGLVHSPHTSSGRVPTVQGYRLFIDNLLTIKSLTSAEIEQLQSSINTEEDTQNLLQSASKILSGVTKMAGVVTVPKDEQNTIKQIEFLSLSENRILAILVYSEKDVQNRIINSVKSYNQDELNRLANCLNAEFVGKDVAGVRRKLVTEMQKAKDHMDQIMMQAIQVANQVFQKEPSTDYIISGETNLMNYEEMADVGRLRQLFEAFNEKQAILNLLDHSLNADGIQIFIGYEAGYDALEECSIITTTYAANDQVIGTLGVIGPTRMAYDKVIPIVDVTAKLLGTMMRERAQ